MYAIHILIILFALLFAFINSLFISLDISFFEELFWLTVSISVITYCYSHYKSNTILIGFSLYILGQFFDVLDIHNQLASNILIRFDTGFKHLGFSVICIALFLGVKEKKLLIKQLTESLEQQTQLKDELIYAAFHDELTDLLNRKALFDSFAQGANSGHTILYMDLDNFKQANDQFGHAKGDEILKVFAQSLIAKFDKDCVFRLGGDEFVAISNLVFSESELINLAESLEEKIKDYNVGVSIGLHQPHQEQDIDEAMHQADLNMYSAKSRKQKIRKTTR